jgi:phosphate transport system substrate-binding protein
MISDGVVRNAQIAARDGRHGRVLERRAGGMRAMRLTRVVLALAALAGCSPRDHAGGTVDAPTVSGLHAAGATFPYPVYTRWFSRYAESTGVRIDYESIGSGE